MKRTLIALLLIALAGGAAIGTFAYLVEPPRQLDLINSLFPGDGKARPVARDIAFGTHERLKLDVYDDPSAKAPAPKPVLVFFYGGGWRMGDKDHYGWAAKAYAAKGFVVVLPDYRLVPGVRYPVFVQDSAAAVAWTYRNIARFGGDPDRITTAGHSAGAYNAVMLAIDPRWLAAQRLPPGVVKAAAGLAGPYDFYPFTKPNSINAMAQWPRPLETQPIEYARAGTPPLWLGHGTADTVVRPYNSANLAAALRKVGSPVEHRVYEGSSHNDLVTALSRVFRTRLPVLDESSAFLTKASAPAARNR